MVEISPHHEGRVTQWSVCIKNVSTWKRSPWSYNTILYVDVGHWQGVFGGLYPLLLTSVYRRPHLVAIRCCCFDCFSLFGVSLSFLRCATQSAISNEKQNKKPLVDRTRLPNFAFSEVHAMMSSSHLRISFLLPRRLVGWRFLNFC